MTPARLRTEAAAYLRAKTGPVVSWPDYDSDNEAHRFAEDVRHLVSAENPDMTDTDEASDAWHAVVTREAAQMIEDGWRSGEPVPRIAAEVAK